jgi:hypothetical protein
MYKPTTAATGYGKTSLGSTRLARAKYGDLGMTLLKSRTDNETGVAVDNVIFSVGPFAQTTGLREENSLNAGVYHRNPIDQRTALWSSFLLYGVGMAGAIYSTIQVRNDNWLNAAIYGATALAGLAAVPNWELRI